MAFPTRWQEWRRLPWSPSNEEMRERHEDLRAFYDRSAERGWPMVKHFSF
ncbi:hypothetical protein ACFC5X_16305 [Streptomyces sp. NPDC055952]